MHGVMSYCCCKYKLLEISRLLGHADMRIIELSRTFYRITWLLRNVSVLGFVIHYYRVTSAQPKCSTQLSPVVQRPISPNPELNFNSGFFISLSKSLLGKIFTINFRTSNDQIASKKIWTEFSLKAFRPEIKFHTNPWYLNPALNNPGLIS